jgi:hypothetical protein
LLAAGILVLAAPSAVFAVGALICSVAGLLVARLPGPAGTVPETGRHDPPVAVDRDVFAGVRAVLMTGDTRLVVGILALRMVTAGALDVLFVLLALETFRIGESGAGLLNAALGVGTILGGALTFSLVGRQYLAPLLAGAALMLGGALGIVGTVAPVWLAAPLIALGGIGYAACDVIGRTILQRVTPDRMLGRVLGVLEGIGLAGLALGAILVPFVVAVIGVQATLVAVGLLLPLGIGLGWFGLAAIDRTALIPIRALELLRAVPFFAPLGPPQAESVARRARWITAAPAEVVIREGDTGDAYYVLESGQLEFNQGERHLRTVSDWGYGFGEIALLRDVPRTATVTAVAPTVLLTIGRADFLEAVTGQAQAFEVARQIAAERAGTPGGR